MKSFHSSPPDSRTGFRLSKELLSSINSICEKMDLSRSQLFRKSINQFIKSLGDQHDVQIPASVEERPTTGWSPELYDRLQRKR